MKQYAEDFEKKEDIEASINEEAKSNTDQKNAKDTANYKDEDNKANSEGVTTSENKSESINGSKKEVNEEKSPTVEDNLELHNLSRKERRRAKRERYKKTTEDMSRKEKINYFFYYFKVPILVGIAVIVSLSLIIASLYKNTRPVAISFALLNSPSVEYLSKDDFKGYMDYYDMPSSYRMLDFYSSKCDLDIYEDYFSKNPDDAIFSQFPTLCYNDYFDIIISDKTGIDYCAKLSLIRPLEDSLDLSMSKYIYENCPERIVEANNVNDEPVAYAIDISGTEFAESLHLDYDDVYIALPGQSERNIANSKRILNYIFEAGLIK